MTKLLPVLVLACCTSTFADIASGEGFRGAAALRPAQVEPSLSGDSQFSIVDEPVFQWQHRTQYNASPALQQVGDINSPRDEYSFPNTAEGVDVYIFDSGIRASHSEFRTISPTGQITNKSRVQQVFSTQHRSAEDDSTVQDISASRGECAEHGTHVASLVGGLTYGVAKGVNIKALEVLSCDGGTDASKLINATEWLIENVKSSRPAIVVMAIGEVGRIHQLDRAIEKCVSRTLLKYACVPISARLSPGGVSAAVLCTSIQHAD